MTMFSVEDVFGRGFFQWLTLLPETSFSMSSFVKSDLEFSEENQRIFERYSILGKL
jgi:hypothetical protein